MRTGFFTLLLIGGLWLAPLSADSLTIPGHRISDNKQTMPRRGVGMELVLEDFGEPVQRIEAIGEPPITSWVYHGFTVYFEYETVLHTIDMNTLVLPEE